MAACIRLLSCRHSLERGNPVFTAKVRGKTVRRVLDSSLQACEEIGFILSWPPSEAAIQKCERFSLLVWMAGSGPAMTILSKIDFFTRYFEGMTAF